MKKILLYLRPDKALHFEIQNGRLAAQFIRSQDLPFLPSTNIFSVNLDLARAALDRKKRLSSINLLKYFFLLIQYIFRYSLALRHIQQFDAVVVWNGLFLSSAPIIDACKRLKIPILYSELGALPGTIVLDPCGVNFQNSLSRRPEFYISQKEIPSDDLHLFNKRLSQIGSRSTQLSQSRQKVERLPKNFIYVPLQVKNDTQIRFFSGWVGSIEQLLQRLIKWADDLPAEFYFVIKEHPSCGENYGELKSRLESHGKAIFASGNCNRELIDKSKGVLTINSSVGLQACLLGKPVLVLGQAFYGMPGLVTVIENEYEVPGILKDWKLITPDEALRVAYGTYLCKNYFIPISDEIYNSDDLEIATSIIGKVINGLPKRDGNF